MPGRRKEFNLWEKRKPPMMECFAGSLTAKQQNKRSQKNIIFMSHRQSMADHRGWLMYAICSDIGFHVFCVGYGFPRFRNLFSCCHSYLLLLSSAFSC